MSKECFCGCGRAIPRFPLGMRAINIRGRQVVERLAINEQIGGRDEPELAGWFAEGEAIVEDIASAIHGDTDPRSLDEGLVRHWQAFGREWYANTARYYADLGSAVEGSGLDEEAAARALVHAMEGGMDARQALDALRRGELQPPGG